MNVLREPAKTAVSRFSVWLMEITDNPAFGLGVDVRPD
jgi:hypothetical protein